MKMVERKDFFAKPKHQTVHPTENNMFIVPNLKKSGDCHENLSLSHFDGWTLILRKIMKIKAFPAKPKHQNYASQ